MASEQVSFFHDSNELLLTDLTISISIGFVDHFLELIIGHSFAQLSGHSLQVFKGDFSSLIVIKKSEGF